MFARLARFLMNHAPETREHKIAKKVTLQTPMTYMEVRYRLNYAQSFLRDLYGGYVAHLEVIVDKKEWDLVAVMIEKDYIHSCLA